MEENYLVIQIGVVKEGIRKGEPYSKLAKIVEYRDKETGQACAFIDLKQTKFINLVFEIGDIRTVTSEII
jgi:hypothetical protein